MKKIFLAVLLFPCFAQAQFVTDSSKFKKFLYEHFMDGHVLMKSGLVEKAPLNYNSEDQSIYFIKNGIYMILTGLNDIDTIYIQHKRFIPVDNKIYEVISESTATKVLVSYSHKVRPLTATTDHGGTAKKSANEVSNTVSDVYMRRNFKAHSSIEIFRQFWLVKDGKLQKADSPKQIQKVYSSKSVGEIDKYIKENSLNLNLENDIVNLVKYFDEQKS
jgi:hypothetical protein